MQGQTRQTAKILVVDDDRSILSLIELNLSAAGYDVQTTENIFDARLALRMADFDLLITDVRLPDGNGIEFAREVIKTSEMGIVIMTGGGDEIDRIIGLELGADDYINKPFHQRELVARVRAILRRLRPVSPGNPVQSKHSKNDLVEFHGYVLSNAHRSLVGKDGAFVSLTTMEFNVLAVLANNKNEVLSRSEINNGIGFRGAAADAGRLIDGLISRLRKKLNSESQPIVWIRTVHGRGYTLTD